MYRENFRCQDNILKLDRSRKCLPQINNSSPLHCHCFKQLKMSGDTSWLLTYFPVAWLAHICQGLAMGIMGPAQPYLAVMVGVPSDQINFIWTLRAFGSCAATVLTGIIFKSFVKTRNLKLSFLSVCVLLIGVFIGLVPWISTFFLLLMSMV